MLGVNEEIMLIKQHLYSRGFHTEKKRSSLQISYHMQRDCRKKNLSLRIVVFVILCFSDSCLYICAYTAKGTANT